MNLEALSRDELAAVLAASRCPDPFCRNGQRCADCIMDQRNRALDAADAARRRKRDRRDAAIAAMLDAEPSLTYRQLAERVGCSVGTIADTLTRLKKRP